MLISWRSAFVVLWNRSCMRPDRESSSLPCSISCCGKSWVQIGLREATCLGEWARVLGFVRTWTWYFVSANEVSPSCWADVDHFVFLGLDRTRRVRLRPRTFSHPLILPIRFWDRKRMTFLLYLGRIDRSWTFIHDLSLSPFSPYHYSFPHRFDLVVVCPWTWHLSSKLFHSLFKAFDGVRWPFFQDRLFGRVAK